VSHTLWIVQFHGVLLGSVLVAVALAAGTPREHRWWHEKADRIEPVDVEEIGPRPR
jgi:hypothetical protein